MTAEQVQARQHVEASAAFTACVAAGRAVQAHMPGWGAAAMECLIRQAEDSALRRMQLAAKLDPELVASLAVEAGR